MYSGGLSKTRYILKRFKKVISGLYIGKAWAPAEKMQEENQREKIAVIDAAYTF